MNKRVRGHLTNREYRLYHGATAFREYQKTIRHMLKVCGNLSNVAETYSNKIPSEMKDPSETIGIPFMAEQGNLYQYMFLMSYDLACLFEDMAMTRSRWKRKLYARLVAITLYECADDFAYLLGKPFRENLIKICMVNLEGERKTMHKEIVEFNKSHQAYLKRIRNSVIGHRDHSAKAQIELIESLKPEQIYRIGSQYFKWQHKLMTILLMPILKSIKVRLETLSGRIASHIKGNSA